MGLFSPRGNIQPTRLHSKPPLSAMKQLSMFLLFLSAAALCSASTDGLTLTEAVHFWPYFNRGSPSRQSLGALGQTSIKSCKCLNGGGGGADAVASDEK